MLVGCMEDDIINENATCGTEKPQHRKGATVDETPVTAKCYHDQVGISIRKGKELEPIPGCQYCKNGIPHNRWRIINRVKRKGKIYNVKQIHIFHAKLALSDDEFQLLLRLLKSSSDTEIIPIPKRGSPNQNEDALQMNPRTDSGIPEPKWGSRHLHTKTGIPKPKWGCTLQ